MKKSMAKTRRKTRPMRAAPARRGNGIWDPRRLCREEVMWLLSRPNDIEFSGEPQSLKKRDEGTRVRCNEGLCGRRPSAPTWPSGTREDDVPRTRDRKP